jgi:hypothetical protein
MHVLASRHSSTEIRRVSDGAVVKQDRDGGPGSPAFAPLNPGFHLIANGFPMARIADAVTLPTPRSAERTGAGGVKLATGGNG